MTLDEALTLIQVNARAHEDRSPTIATLLAEVAELAYALEDRHEDPPELELVELGGIVVNMLRRYTLESTQSAIAANVKRKHEQ